MKSVMLIAILFLLVGAIGYSDAQTVTLRGKLLNADRTANFSVTATNEESVRDKQGNDTGYRKFVNETVVLGGTGAYVDFILDPLQENPLQSIEVWGYVPDDTGTRNFSHFISCQNFRVIETHNKPPTLINSMKLVATCDFYLNGYGNDPVGIAYIVLNGSTYRSSDTDVLPYKIIFAGTVGGGNNVIDNNFIFKGSFGTMLKPVVP